MGNVSLNGDGSFATNNNHNPQLLQPVAIELLGVAARLFDLASSSIDVGQFTDSPPKLATQFSRNYLALARHAYMLRRKRSEIFKNPDLFGEPAWDILLDLYIAHADGKSVSVSSACIGSASPATTGLRWLGVLADEGLILRENDTSDQRRVMVRLTDAGMKAMERYFDAVEAGG